jgi:cell division protein FtsB
VAEGGGLLNRYRSKAYHRFESCHLRHHFKRRWTGYLPLVSGNPFFFHVATLAVLLADWLRTLKSVTFMQTGLYSPFGKLADKTVA